MTDMRKALQRYEFALVSGNRSSIIALVDELLDSGVAPLAILTELVAVAQFDIGRRWQRGEWSVAQEHAATAMAMAATEVVTRRVEAGGITRGHVLITCAEREWHWLPAAIVACALRSDGWQTTSLGPATTPARLSQYIQDIGPDAVAVSCSVLGSLPTTRRFIEASTAAGVPVVVGGAALGGDDVRAKALGATAWAPDARGAIEALAGLPVVVSPAPPLPAAAAAEQAALEHEHQHLVDRVRRQWSITADTVSDDAAAAAMRAVARDALPQSLHAVSAALLTGDPRPVEETSAWITDLLDCRGVDTHKAMDDLKSVLSAVLLDYPLTATLVRKHFLVEATADEQP